MIIIKRLYYVFIISMFVLCLKVQVLAVPVSNLDGMSFMEYRGEMEYTDDNNKLIKAIEYGIAGKGHHDEKTQEYITEFDDKLEKDEIILFIDGCYIRKPNIIRDGDRTLIPLRLVSETLGAVVSYDDALRKVTITKRDTKIEMFIGNSNVTKNNVKITLDTSPKIYNNYTYVPVRFVSEAFGAEVLYFDGRYEIEEDGFIPQNITQILIDQKYKDVKVYTKDEAISIVREGYEKVYRIAFNDDYVPQKSAKENDEEYGGIRTSFAEIIDNLEVVREVSRYYIIKGNWYVLFDKYTGECFKLYPGYAASINKLTFNKASEAIMAG